MKKTSKNIDDLLLSVRSNSRRDVLLSEDQVNHILVQVETSSVPVLVPKSNKVVYSSAAILICGIVLYSYLHTDSVPDSYKNKIAIKEEQMAGISMPPSADASRKVMLSSSVNTIEGHSKKLLNRNHAERLELPANDNISSIGYIMLTSQEFTDLQKAIPATIEIKETLSNTKIPIQVRSESDQNVKSLWYYPTNEFLAVLPERYRLPLEKELAVIDEAEKKNLCAGDVCQKLTAPSFFDYCRSQSGTIERSSLSPNPAQKETIAELDLSESRTISVSVYDQSGKFISKILSGHHIESGIQKVKIDLRGLSQGAYLLAISTEKGEQVIQRIIVQ